MAENNAQDSAKQENASAVIRSLQLDPKTEAVLRKKGYQMEKKVSEGAFGQVFKGRDMKTGEAVAIKVMFLEKLGKKYEERFWPRELAALKEIRHEHIISVYDIIRCSGKLFIFMEFANDGDITGYLKRNGPIHEEVACYWFTQATEAMAYMHEVHHFAHRDIKIDNVLLHNNKAKMTDFGFARHAWNSETNEVQLSTTFCGTAPYYCPQIVEHKAYSPFAADVWAMGVMLFAMLNNKFPFHFNSKDFLREQKTAHFIRTRFIKKFPEDLINLHEQIFVVDEKVRTTMPAILLHPWILRKGKPALSPRTTLTGNSQ